MRRALLTVLLLLGATPLVWAQHSLDTARLITNPEAPSSDVLDRLHMKQSWRAFIPIDGKRDGIFSVQFAPYIKDKKEGLHILVQNRSGFVVCLDALTGQQVWRALLGRPYQVTQPVAFNNRAVVAFRGTDIYALDRFTGLVVWETRVALTSTLETAPVMDAKHIFVTRSSDNVIFAFDLPGESEKEPRKAWDYRPFLPVDLPPKMTENFLVMPSSRGSVQVMFKDVAQPYLRYRTEGILRATVGIHEQDAFIYIGSSDTNVYAERVEDVTTQRPWRFTAGTAIIHTPMVNDREVYASAERRGVFQLLRKDLDVKQLEEVVVRRGFVTADQYKTVVASVGAKGKDPRAILDALQNQNYMTARQRTTLPWQGGDQLWENKMADRVLAVNPKFVYATDMSGRLMILSRATGKEFSRWEAGRDFVYPIVNEMTDRLYLAAHNGIIVCLHDTDYPNPVVMKTMPPMIKVKQPVKPPEPPKDPPKEPPPMGGGMMPE